MYLTKAEAINLILGFYTTPTGYWTEIEYNIPELTRFINAGMTCLDEENCKRIIPNEQGYNILRSHFEEIAIDFIAFMQKKGLECPANELASWFVEKYSLADLADGEDVAFYIAKKLDRFGYIAFIPHPERKTDKFILQKI